MTNDVHSLIARARELLGRVPEGDWEAIGDPTEWGFKTVVMRDERFHESLRTVCEVTRLGETRHPTEPLEDETCSEDMAITELIAESRTLLPALADDAEKMLGLLMTVAQNARMVRAIAESYAELDPKWAKSTLDYFHGVVTEPLERAYAELSAKEVTP